MGEYRDRVIVNPSTGTVRGLTSTGEVLTLSGVRRSAAPKIESTPTRLLPENFDLLPGEEQSRILRDLHIKGQEDALKKARESFVHPRIRGRKG